jgi:tetratricopeptide (TPR) repeat protein
MIPTPSSTLAGPEPALSARQTRERRIVFLLLLVAVNLALFLPSMTGDFLWDDKYFISENPNIQGGGLLRSFLFSPFGGFSGADENSVRQDRIMRFYRPLVSLSYWLDFRIWGLNPAAFHLTNILIHTVNVMVFFYILIGLSFGPHSAFFGAFLFSVYPLHFENVSWISGRTDLLAFLFTGLSVLLFIRFFKRQTPLSLAGSGAAYFLGLLCKENVLMLPLIFLFFLYKKEGQAGKAARVLSRLWPHALALLGWLILRWNALGSAPIGHSGRTVLDFLAAIGFYSWKIIFPFNLSLTVDALPVLRDTVFRILGALLAVAFAISIRQALRKSLERGWLYWSFMGYVLILLPSALVIFSSSAISLVAWRFLYLPSAVLIAALVGFLESRLKLKALAVGAVVLLAALSAAEVYPKNILFGKDETHFWLSIKNPDREDVIARFNIGVKSLPTDEKRALGLFDTILSQKDRPGYQYWKTRIYEELGIYYAVRRDFAKAEPYFRELFRTQVNPSLRLRFNYAYYLAFSGKSREGERTVLEMLGLFPRNHYVITQAAKFYVIVQDYERAAELYAEDYRLFRNRQSRLLAEEAGRLRQKTR